MRIRPESIGIITWQSSSWHPPFAEAPVWAVKHLIRLEPILEFYLVCWRHPKDPWQLSLDRLQQWAWKPHELVESRINPTHYDIILRVLRPYVMDGGISLPL